MKHLLTDSQRYHNGHARGEQLEEFLSKQEMAELRQW